MEDLKEQIKLLTSRLAEMEKKKDGASSESQKAAKIVVVPRERGTKLAGRPKSERDPEVTEWAEDMRRLTKDLSDAEGAQLVLDHLTGPARDEVRLCSPSERGKPESIISHVLKAYTCFETPSLRWQDFYSRRQRGGESVQEFSLQLMKLLRKVELASSKETHQQLHDKDAVLCEKFAAGLSDPSLQREVRRYVQENPLIQFTDLRNKVLSWEIDHTPLQVVETRATAARPTDLSVQLQLDKQASQLKATQEAVEHLCKQMAMLLQSPTLSGASKSSLTCYSCGGAGHIARWCPSSGRRWSQKPAYADTSRQQSTLGTPQATSWLQAPPFHPQEQTKTSQSKKSPNASPPS